MGPAMDRRVIDEKLESLRRCLARVEAKVPATAEQLAADPDAQDIVVLNLERAVQVCVDLGTHLLAALEARAADTMADTFARLQAAGVLDDATAERMAKAVGFRNLAVHAYAALDWTITHKIATEHLDDFRAYARAVDAWAATH